MLYLRNGCRASEPKVLPKTWQRSNASTKKPWQIYYRFYDPRYKDQYPKGKLVPVRKFLNDHSDLPTRQAIATRLLAEVNKMLLDGYNPHDEAYMEERTEYLVAPRSSLLCALEAARESFKSRQVYADLKSTLKQLTPFFREIGIETTAVCDISRRHIKALLMALERSGKFTNKRINKLRDYLSMLFSHLLELEAIEINPCRDIKALPVVETVRETCTVTQRRAVYDFLLSAAPSFQRFMVIFFYSGSRIRELLHVQHKHVDLDRQEVKYTVYKGGKPFEVIRPITDEALRLWKEAYAECGSKDDFLFSKGLAAGQKPIRTDQIGRRWKTWVKKNAALGITADFYSLKHSNLDEITALLSKEEAARLAAHSSTRMVEKHYAVGEESRKLERLKRGGNSFTGGTGTVTIPLPAGARPLRAGK